MKNKLALIVVIAGLAACNGGGKTPPSENGDACYQAINDRDSVNMSIAVKDNMVSGNLSYNYFEKDKNTGTIAGKMIGDTLLADYTFMSEGMQSIRQVIFLKKGNELIEGFGPLEDINGKTLFKHRDSLVFNTVNSLQKIECPK